MNKITKLTLATAALLIGSATAAFAGDNDDFGLWTEAEFQKKLPYNMSIGVSGEVRTENNSSRIDRMSLGVSFGYKVNKYFKLGASYSLLESYRTSKTEDKSYRDRLDGGIKKSKDQIVEGESKYNWFDLDDYPADLNEYKKYRLTDCNGYNYTPSFWRARHRLSIDATGSVKIAKILRVSLRERYQYTSGCTKNVNQHIVREKFNRRKNSPTMDANTMEWYIDPDEWEVDEDYNTEAEKNTDSIRVKTFSYDDSHILRSRLTLEIDKKNLNWSPFISVEAHNNLVAQHGEVHTNVLHLEKLRTMVGTEYKFNKQHSLSMAYILTCNYEEPITKHMHAISIGYNFDF